MDSKRAHDGRLDGDNYMGRRPVSRTMRPDDERTQNVSAPTDEDEGQLGPDELPDPVEVVMNHEAKTHH
jgi:hypothetical protein